MTVGEFLVIVVVGTVAAWQIGGWFGSWLGDWLAQVRITMDDIRAVKEVYPTAFLRGTDVWFSIWMEKSDGGLYFLSTGNTPAAAWARAREATRLLTTSGAKS